MYNKKLSGKEISIEERNHLYDLGNNFFSYFGKNETNIQDKLKQNMLTKAEAFSKYSDSLPFENNVNIEDQEKKETRSEERDKVDNTPVLGTIAPLVEMADQVEGVSSNDDYYAPFREINNIYANRQSACNKGSEPLIDFIERFCDDKEFRKSRIKLSERIDIANKITRKTFNITVPDSNGFFTSWDDIKEDLAVFSSGWMESEMSERYEFRRIDGKWYLVDYIEYS